MNRREMFRRYAAQCKRSAPAGYRRDGANGVTRFTPVGEALEGIVTFSEHSAESVDDAIAEQVVYFDQIGRDFEWKVYDFDTPADLATRLEAWGFLSGDREAFLIYDLERYREEPHGSEFRIERVTTHAGVREVVDLQAQVWGRSYPGLESSLLAAMDRTAVYCAYTDDGLVGTGWIEFPEGVTFAELHGGAVLPAMRGRGVYSALLAARLGEAKRRGAEFVAVDAAPMSRPILLKKGLRYVCDTIPFRKNASK